MGSYAEAAEIPRLHKLDTQPHIKFVVHGGSNPTVGIAMVDTGAAFCMISEGVVKAHGLKIFGHEGSFKNADQKTVTKLLGKVDVTL
jgi:hypothetical protein